MLEFDPSARRGSQDWILLSRRHGTLIRAILLGETLVEARRAIRTIG
jgi:hypothetical protein